MRSLGHNPSQDDILDMIKEVDKNGEFEYLKSVFSFFFKEPTNLKNIMIWGADLRVFQASTI